MTEEQRSNLEAMAEIALMHWQYLSDGPQATALISAYAQCMQALQSDRIAAVIEFFRTDYEKDLEKERQFKAMQAASRAMRAGMYERDAAKYDDDGNDDEGKHDE